MEGDFNPQNNGYPDNKNQNGQSGHSQEKAQTGGSSDRSYEYWSRPTPPVNPPYPYGQQYQPQQSQPPQTSPWGYQQPRQQQPIQPVPQEPPAPQPQQQPYSWSYAEQPRDRSKKRNRGLVVFAVMLSVIFAIGLFTVAGIGVYSIIRDGGLPGISDFFTPSTQDHSQGGDQDPGQSNDSDTPQLNIGNTPKTNIDENVTVGDPMTFQEIARTVRPSVVGIVSMITDGTNFGTATGSGIIMTQDGYIITNAHVIDGASTVTVVLDDSTQLPAEVIGQDTKTDLAVLKIDADGLSAAQFGDSDALVVGDTVVAIGNPYGLELAGTVTNGIISALNRDIEVDGRYMNLIQTNASINPGNSGGPLVNIYGQVIGINSVKIGSADYEGLGFSIPINSAKPVIDDLIQYGYVKGRPMIGIGGRDLDAATARYMNLPQGVYVLSVNEGTDAYGKVQEGDVVVGVNGTDITTMAELNKIKDAMSSEDSITLTIYRQGKKFDVTVKLYENTPDQ